MIKIFIEPSQYVSEKRIIIDDLPDGMDHTARFVIFVRIFWSLIDSIYADDRLFIIDQFSLPDIVIVARFFTKIIPGENGFTVTGESFMYPFIGDVFA